MKSPKRGILIATALVATLVAAYYAPARPDQVDEPVAGARSVNAEPRTETIPAAASPTKGEMFTAVIRPREDGDDDELLAAFSSVPAPAPVAVRSPLPVAPLLSPAVAAIPQGPPPVPFQVVGKIVDGTDQRVFLIFNGQNLVVHTGDAIGPDYTVSTITADQLTVHYVPLDVSQTVALPTPH